MTVMITGNNSPAEAATPSAAQSFQERFAFVVVSRKRPSFVTKVDGLQVLAADKPLAEDMTKSQVALLPKQWEKKLNVAYGAVVQVAERRTLPFELGTVNVRVLPRSGQLSFWGEVAEARLALAGVLNEFLTVYDTEVVAWNRERWAPYLDKEEYEAKIGRKLPPRAVLADPQRRRLGVFIYTLGIGEDYLTASGTEGLEEEAQQACATGRRELRAAIEGCVGGLRDRIRQAVENLAAQLNDGSKLSVHSLKETQDAIVLARSFADMADPALLTHLGHMEKQLLSAVASAEGVTGKKGDTQTAALLAHRNGLLDAIGQLEAACRNPAGVKQVLQTRFGAAPRLLERPKRPAPSAN